MELAIEATNKAEISNLEFELLRQDIESVQAERLEERLREFDGLLPERTPLSDVDSKEIHLPEGDSEKTHSLNREVSQIHHPQGELSSRSSEFDPVNSGNVFNAGQDAAINTVMPSVQQLSEHRPIFKSSAPVPLLSDRMPRTKANSMSSVSSAESFQPLPHPHLPVPTPTPTPRLPYSSSCRGTENIEDLWNSSPINPETKHESLDSWIDKLIPYQETVIPHEIVSGISLEQSLLRLEHGRDSPKVELLRFSGVPLEWPRFIERFYEHVHNKPFSTDSRRMTLLQMHYLEGQAKLLVQGLGCDGKAYALALKWLKQRFGHPVLVARAVIEQVTKGEKIPSGNRLALSLFHTDLRNCLFTLERMNFYSDVFSSDNLRMVIARLPPGLRRSWAKTSQLIHVRETPNLVHFEAWLNTEVETAYDPDLPVDDKPMKRRDNKVESKSQDLFSARVRTLATKSETGEVKDNTVPLNAEAPCPLCTLNHHLGRCWKYQNKSAAEKLVVARTEGLCFNCLRPGHIAENCSSKFVCRVPNCNKKHHSSLHDSPSVKKYNTTKTTSVGVNTNSDFEVKKVEATQAPGSTKVFIQMVPVRVKNEQGVAIDTFALLDPCSEATLICEDLASMLRLDGPSNGLSIGTVLSDGEHQSLQLVDFTVGPVSNTIPSTEIKVNQAWTVPHLNVPSRRQHLPSDGTAFPYLDGLSFPDISSSDIALLIGANVPEALVALEVRCGPKSQPLAVHTALGWTLLGSNADAINQNDLYAAASVNFVSVPDERLHRSVESFWRTESFGCSFEGKIPQSVEDQCATRKLEETTTHTGKQYEIGMLWRCDNPVLPYNRVLAETRLEHLERKLCKDKELETAHRYNPRIRRERIC